MSNHQVYRDTMGDFDHNQSHDSFPTLSLSHLGMASIGPEGGQYGSSSNSTVPFSNKHNPIPWNLARFYNSEAPWHPPGIAPALPPDGQTGHQRPSLSFNPNAPSFQHHRGNLPSECDTLQEDSGYVGSVPTYSLKAPSVYDEERSLEAQRAASHFESLHIDSSAFSHATGSTTAPAPGDSYLYCPDCHNRLKNRSELNKHIARHKKPHTCSVAGCPRSKEGFSTRNDLERHKKSLHPDLGTCGDRYICRLGTCGSKEKIWPRADNFRSHLDRVHRKKLTADDNLEEFLYHPPSRLDDLQGVGTAITIPTPHQSMGDAKSNDEFFSAANLFGERSMSDDPALNNMFVETPSSPTKTLSMFSTAQNDEGVFIQPNVLTESIGMSKPRNNSEKPDACPTHPSQRHDQIASNESANDDTLDQKMSSESPRHLIERPSGSENQNLSHKNSNTQLNSFRDVAPSGNDLDVQPMDEQEDRMTSTHSSSSSPRPATTTRNKAPKAPIEVVKYLKSLPRESLKNLLYGPEFISADHQPRETPSNKARVSCSACDKQFSRQCELKKHMKRHEKPYGCTFRNCTKTFGSKNDWKRHESSQHFQLESWKCEEQKPNKQESCDKICTRRESFRNHLQKDHMLDNQREIEEKLDRCRIGRHCHKFFWCGFCEGLLEIDDEGVNAWTWRCDHIDDHFFGRRGLKKVSIDKWKHLEDQEDKQSVALPEPNPGRTIDQAPLVTPSASSKRKRSMDADSQPFKRRQTQQGPAYMWTCCQCNEFLNGKTSASCFSCGHVQCKQNCNFDFGTNKGLTGFNR